MLNYRKIFFYDYHKNSGTASLTTTSTTMPSNHDYEKGKKKQNVDEGGPCWTIIGKLGSRLEWELNEHTWKKRNQGIWWNCEFNLLQQHPSNKRTNWGWNKQNPVSSKRSVFGPSFFPKVRNKIFFSTFLFIVVTTTEEINGTFETIGKGVHTTVFQEIVFHSLLIFLERCLTSLDKDFGRRYLIFFRRI